MLWNLTLSTTSSTLTGSNVFLRINFMLLLFNSKLFLDNVVLFIFLSVILNALSSSLSCLTFTNTLWMCGNQSINIFSFPIHVIIKNQYIYYSKTSDWFNKGLVFVIDLFNYSGDLYNDNAFIYNCG